MDASVRNLKANLSRYLKRVERGEEVTITSRGRVVAKLVGAGLHSEPEPDEGELLRRLASVPGIIPGKPGKPMGSKHPTRTRKGQKLISDIVIEDRR